jgi:hypothetical protein
MGPLRVPGLRLAHPHAKTEHICQTKNRLDGPLVCLVRRQAHHPPKLYICQIKSRLDGSLARAWFAGWQVRPKSRFTTDINLE